MNGKRYGKKSTGKNVSVKRYGKKSTGKNVSVKI